MKHHESWTAFNREQALRASKLFSAIVLAALDDAVVDQRRCGKGVERITRWARSRDGMEVLSCAGIDPNERVVQGLVDFVRKGSRISDVLTRISQEKGRAVSLQG